MFCKTHTMKLKTFLRKDGTKIDVQLIKSFNSDHIGNVCRIVHTPKNGEYEDYYSAYYYDYKEFLKINEVVECFNNRYFTNINGKSNTIILENGECIPDEIYAAAEYASCMGFGRISNIFQPFLSLEKSSGKEGYDKYLYDYIVNNKIKNVFIDSIFKNRSQFENIAKNVFRWTPRVNIFVNSHTLLLSILNEYVDDKEFRFLIDVCNIYDVNFSQSLASKVSYDYLTKKFIHENDYHINWK